MDKQQQLKYYIDNHRWFESSWSCSILHHQLGSVDICYMNMPQYHFLQHPMPEPTCYQHQLEHSSNNNSLVNNGT